MSASISKYQQASSFTKKFGKAKVSMLFFVLAVFLLFMVPGILPATFAQSVLPNAITKQNSMGFAGYEISTSTIDTITLVQSSYVVPKVTCGPSETDSTPYAAGIQADDVGMDVGCTSGSAFYGHFCEVVAVETCPGISISDTISPGDKMKTVVTLSYSTHMATIKLMDMTKSWTYTYTFADTEETIDAFWVLQPFSSTFPNFGTMKISSNFATIGTHHGTIMSFSSITSDEVLRLNLVDSTMHTMASTSALSSSGSAFSIKWKSAS